MAKMTMGTSIFAILPILDSDMLPTSSMEVVNLGCVKGINVGDNQPEQVDVTCLEAFARQYEAGIETPGTSSLTIDADPSKNQHVRLYRATKIVDGKRPTIKFAIGWADGTSSPTLATDSDGNTDFTLPTERTWNRFDGYVSGFPFNFQIGAAVASEVSIQNTGESNWYPKAV